jgi:hypothetical protein
MGLQATLAAGVATIFGAFGDLVVTMPIQEPSTFVPITEVETPGATGTVRVIQMTQVEAERYFAGLNWRGIAGDTQASDVQLIAEVASATLAPNQNMTATWLGNEYSLHRVDNSAQVVLLLSLRKPA